MTQMLLLDFMHEIGFNLMYGGQKIFTVAKQKTCKRNMYLCRPEVPMSEVRIPLKSNHFLFPNISNNLEKVLLSIQMSCLLILKNVYLFFSQLALFIV